ncbi:MAG: hypothetical protein MUC88_00250 [Planctomycetes bacterium]|jgi:hypothetical protein|nr:hypothetical protein [Planctomycetota bacterium]
MANESLDALTEGYRAYREWAEAMASAGFPLPPGGTCMITRRGVFLTRLLDLRLAIARELQLPVEAIKVELDTHPLTQHLVPRIDVDFPPGYMAVPHPSIQDSAGKSPEQLGQEHAKAVIGTFYQRFLADVNDRIAAFARSERPDLDTQQWEDLLGQGRDIRGHADPFAAD